MRYIMEKFSTQKKGYNKQEVELFIMGLEMQLKESNLIIKQLNEKINILNNKIDEYKQKENLISKSLELAIESGEKIKQKSKEELEKIKLLSKELNDLKINYKNSDIDTNTNIQNEIDKDYFEIEKNCQNLSGCKKTIISDSTTGKLNNFEHIILRTKKPSEQTLLKDKVEHEHKKEINRLKNSPLETFFKNINMDNNDENLIDNYLENGKLEKSAEGYNKEFKNKNNETSGFSLKEALNPTVDLEEIMKAFDDDE